MIVCHVVFISYIIATIICIGIVIIVIIVIAIAIVIIIYYYYYETGDYPPSYFLFILNLLCYKTISADNSIWISTLYKYGILYMKTYLTSLCANGPVEDR